MGMNGFRPHIVRRAVAELQQENAKKLMVETWISQTIEGDAKLGRTGACFTVDPAIAVGQEARKELKARGVICYAGSGNYFQADLTGGVPRIIHRRPLAQRYVQLVIGGTA